MKTQYVGVTMGDPAGIGPEIVLGSLAHEDVYSQCRPVVIGSRQPLEDAAAVLGGKQRIRVVDSPQEGEYGPDTVNLIDLPLEQSWRAGVMSQYNGQISIAYMEKSYELLRKADIAAVSCAPCNKEAMKLAGSPFIGATELYAHFAGDVKTFTVIEQAGCYIFQLTAHLSLRKALERITEDALVATMRTAHAALTSWGIERPRLALSALNPHAGDGGSLGTEEIEMFSPALKKLESEGIVAAGPIPADSIFIKGYDGVYDGIVLLFHDTANIAVKLMEKTYPSVVITGGLPFIRTTVAHGTAYDIAYKGMAGHRQMLNAILAAARIGGRLLEQGRER